MSDRPNPLIREDRVAILVTECSTVADAEMWLRRYEATVQQAEAQRDCAVAALREVERRSLVHDERREIARVALAKLDREPIKWAFSVEVRPS